MSQSPSENSAGWIVTRGQAGASTIADVWRGRIVSVTRLGDDVRIDLEGPGPSGRPSGERA